MTDIDRLIDALAECIVARQGLPNRDRAKLVLAEIEAQGWVIVPKEPTGEMVHAGWRKMPTNVQPLPSEAKATWSAMIAAAPKEEA